MDTQHFFGGGGGTTLHVTSVILVLIAGILIGLLPRRHVFIPLLVATTLVPITEQVVVAGVHLTLSRLLILLALIRRSAINHSEPARGGQ
ncbi:MAG: hypothetical protein QOJ99_3359, partial [Bryobacterales bacterium]|nr:hypothetical protein [Bryobacterales bacterium]